MVLVLSWQQQQDGQSPCEHERRSSERLRVPERRGGSLGSSSCLSTRPGEASRVRREPPLRNHKEVEMRRRKDEEAEPASDRKDTAEFLCDKFD